MFLMHAINFARQQQQQQQQQQLRNSKSERLILLLLLSSNHENKKNKMPLPLFSLLEWLQSFFHFILIYIVKVSGAAVT